MHTKQKTAKCMVVGDIMSCKFGAENTDMMVECFHRIKTEQLNRLMGKRN